ncbi:ComF family protein [Anaerosolibacter carboniphilus]|uniref:ComF family protein n=1 Tax=Anaerosolibacter carboniphilus TaxID=1417629 RepID=A0A841KSL2_9FIRM|nr:ComF family protein [Anaerosolibacter carboniphilus]MBB6216407.1 ComF family protein [Anaerosolibacter carboniphilus]
MGYKTMVNELIETLLDFVYPRNIYCILCGEVIEKTESYSLCTTCQEQVKFITSRFCEKCGKPLESMYLPQKCPDCIQNVHYFTKGFSCIEYDDNIKKLVYDLKYHNKRYLAYHMAEMMTARFMKLEWEKPDVIVPIPLHPKKEKERGFNQSALIAKYIGESLDIPVEYRSVLRTKETETQNRLNREERKENLKNAFQIIKSQKFTDKKVLILDDIYTTGSTMDACAKELCKMKPKEIIFMTFATGRNV